MKKFRFLACFMAILTVVSIFGATVTASAVHIVNEEATVYFDGKKVKNVDAYVDDNGDFRVSSVEELYRILPDLEEEVFVLPNKEGYVIIDYLEYVLYSHTISGNNLYISTDKEINLKDVLPEKMEGDATVYVNGLLVKTESSFVSKGEAYVNDFDDIYAIFPKETKNTYLPFTKEVTSLKDWADRYNYTYALSGTRVYLNNNGQIPLEITVNGTVVDFPDQQPIVVPPGRTMVPVHSITKLVGADITWDAKNQRVIIEKDSDKLILWLGYSKYWFNGYYYNMDVKPYALNGRTMVPIAFVSKVFGYTAKYDGTPEVDVVSLSSNW